LTKSYSNLLRSCNIVQQIDEIRT